jgi:hypothetical protein
MYPRHVGLHGPDSGIITRLLLAVLFGMSLYRLFSMPSAMNYVAPRGVSVVCRLFVVSCSLLRSLENQRQQFINFLVGRHGAMNPAGRVRCNMPTKLGFKKRSGQLTGDDLTAIQD